jgi:hypothetical protein
MEYAKLETAALAHVDDSYYYGAYCRKCKHSARLSLVKLCAHLGDGFPLVKVKDRLRYERCSSRQTSSRSWRPISGQAMSRTYLARNRGSNQVRPNAADNLDCRVLLSRAA